MAPGELLKARREKLGLTQAGLARRANLARQVINGIERGLHDGSTVTWLRLAIVLGLEKSQLPEPKKPGPKPGSKHKPKPKPEPKPEPTKKKPLELKKCRGYRLGKKRLVYLYDQGKYHIFAELASGLLVGYTDAQLGWEEKTA